MGHKDQDKRKELIREEVFKFIAQNAGDLGTLKERLLRVVSSRTKIKNAIDELVQSGRLVIKGKNIEVSQDVVLTGTFYSSSGKKSVVIEGQSQRYELSRKDDNLSYNNGQKVKVAVVVKQAGTKPGIVQKIFRTNFGHYIINFVFIKQIGFDIFDTIMVCFITDGEGIDFKSLIKQKRNGFFANEAGAPG